MRLNLNQKLIILFLVLVIVSVIINVIVKNKDKNIIKIEKNSIEVENEDIIIINASKALLVFHPINVSMSSDNIKFIITESRRTNPTDIKGINKFTFILTYNPNVIIVQNVTEVDVSGLLIDIDNTKGRTEIIERFINKSISDNSSEYLNENEYSVIANISFKFVGSKNDKTILYVSRNFYQDTCYGISNISAFNSQKCFSDSVEPLLGIYQISYNKEVI